MLAPKGRSLLSKQEKSFKSESADANFHFEPYVIPKFGTVLNKSEIIEIEQAEDVAAIQDIHLTTQDKSNDDEFNQIENSSNEIDDNHNKSHSDDNNKEETNEESGDKQNPQTRYEICKKSIDILIEYLRIPSESKATRCHPNLYNILDKWIDSPHDEIPHCELITNDNPMKVWARIQESHQFKKWHQLADIALHIYEISATETICERIISLQGHLSKDKSQRAKGELCDAILIHMQHKDAMFK